MLTPRVGVIAVLLRDESALLVRRGKAPALGRWGFPGGSLEWGETLFEGAKRELKEETGVTARPVGVLDAVDVIARDAAGAIERHFALIAIRFADPLGAPVAGDDAAEARWVRPDETEALDPLPDVLRLWRSAAGGSLDFS